MKKTKTQKSKIASKTPVKKTVLKTETLVENKPLVLLLGDQNLVEEFQTLCNENTINTLTANALSSRAKKITLAFELTLENNEQKKAHLVTLDKVLPNTIPIVTSAVTVSVLEQVQALHHKNRVLGISAFPTCSSHTVMEIAPSIYTHKDILEAVTVFFSSLKKETALVTDAVGMVMPRILCQLTNEALFAIQHDIAEPRDIDDALKLAMNFSLGPIEWGEQVGFKNVVTVLDALHTATGEERYRVAPLLRQMAIAGTFWKK